MPTISELIKLLSAISLHQAVTSPAAAAAQPSTLVVVSRQIAGLRSGSARAHGNRYYTGPGWMLDSFINFLSQVSCESSLSSLTSEAPLRSDLS